MTHVLFDGDIRRHPGLRSLFWQFGVTVGSLSAADWALPGPTVEDCDAVVYLGGENRVSAGDSGAMPDGAETEGEFASAAAPLLVIGSWLANESLKTPWVTIPDPGPGGSHLRAALQSCQERSRMLRGDPDVRHDRNQFRNFLGHELRSPLTAINTALTVLAAEKDQGSDSAKMLAIARRNLTRLTRTVDWSQELLALADSPLTAALGPISLVSLAESLPDHLEVRLGDEDRAFEVMTDPRLLGVLAVQMERVLAYACPGNRPVFRLDLDPGTRDCRLTATVRTDPTAPHGTGASRTGGVPTGQALVDESGTELQHLVQYLISPDLTQVLGVKPRVTCTDPGTVALNLGLPGWTGKYSPLSETSLSF